MSETIEGYLLIHWLSYSFQKNKKDGINMRRRSLHDEISCTFTFVDIFYMIEMFILLLFIRVCMVTFIFVSDRGFIFKSETN